MNMNSMRVKLVSLLFPLLIVFGLSTGCRTAPRPERVAAQEDLARERLGRLAWLVGDWRMEREGGFTGESWISLTPSLLMGMGYTVKAGSLTAHESIRLEARAGDLIYIAQVRASVPGIEFRMTEISDRHVLFRNPEHDFPTWIRYERSDSNQCMATVGNDTGQIEFRYTRYPYAPILKD